MVFKDSSTLGLLSQDTYKVSKSCNK